MRVMLLSAMLLGVAACSPLGVPGANVDLTPPAFAERPPPALPPPMAANAAPPPVAPMPAPAASQPGAPVPLTPAPGLAPSAELAVPPPPGPPPAPAATAAAQLPPPPPEIASPAPPPPVAAVAPPPPAAPPPPMEVAAAPVPLTPQPLPAEAAAPPPGPEPVAVAAPPPPPASGFALVWPFFVSNQPVPGQLPGPHLTLSNFSYDRAHVEMTVTANPECGADTVSQVEFDLAYNGTRVIQPPVGDDVCWRRDTSMDAGGGPQWSRWNRAFLSAGRSVDSRL